MSTELNFSAFKENERLHKIAEATAKKYVVDCGWLSFEKRTAKQNEVHDVVVGKMPRFGIRGRFRADQRRYPLWQAPTKLLGHFLKYIWQQTGSCVGAGGGNMLKTLMCVEIVLGMEPEEYREPWWLFTYGRSRYHAGIRGTGEGSTGSGWAKAIVDDGSFEIDPEGAPDLPDYKENNGWLVQPSRIEMEWSDGARIKDEWLRLGQKNKVKTAARCRSADDVAEALINGYPVTQASMFGFNPMVPRPQGDPPVRLAEWNGRWAHQTWIDEYWDHPSLGEIFRWGNNWGPTAHGSPTGDEPPGGVYIRKKTVDEICRSGEVYAFSGYDGFPARELDFSAF